MSAQESPISDRDLADAVTFNLTCLELPTIVFWYCICDRHSFFLQAVTLLIGLIARAREEPTIEVKVYPMHP